MAVTLIGSGETCNVSTAWLVDVATSTGGSRGMSSEAVSVACIGALAATS